MAKSKRANAANLDNLKKLPPKSAPKNGAQKTRKVDQAALDAMDMFKVD